MVHMKEANLVGNQLIATANHQISIGEAMGKKDKKTQISFDSRESNGIHPIARYTLC